MLSICTIRNYFNHCIYFIGHEYLNAVLWDLLPENSLDDSPERWQRDMCEKLGLGFHSTIWQPSNIVGELLGG